MQILNNSNIDNPNLSKKTKFSTIEFVPTNNPYSQPRVFNLIDATKYRGIGFGIISSLIFLFVNIELYYNFLPAEILLILGFCYFKYVLLKAVVNGKIPYTANVLNDTLLVGGSAFTLMRSAFIRPFLILIITLLKGYNEKEIIKFASSGMNIWWSYLIGIVVFGIAYFILMRPATYSVVDGHKKIVWHIREIQNKNMYETTVKNKYTFATPTSNFYNPSTAKEQILSDSQTEKNNIESMCHKKAQTPVQKSNTKISEPVKETDVFGNNRVCRKRRTF